VFHVVAPATGKMAMTTILALGKSHMLRHIAQIHFTIGIPGSCEIVGLGRSSLTVSIGGIMTHQTVDVVLVVEIKFFVGITIPRMAFGTQGFVGIDANAKIVQHVGFSQIHHSTAGNGILFVPLPVFGFHHLFSGGVVAAQARLRDFGSRFKILL